MSLGPGVRLGTYEIVSQLGSGGMGEVYLAHDPRLGRDVAVKVLPASLATDYKLLRRFEQEARAVAVLSHPNIVAVHDIGNHDGVPYLVMEYVPGETLATHLRRERFSHTRALEIAVQIAEALSVAHGKKVVHRDLKPGNVMITPDGRIKVLDFGLAKSLVSDTATTGMRGRPTNSVQTQFGQLLGTPGYMSPEQLMGDRVDHRTDLYSLGVTLFELVTGQRPFRGTDFDTIRDEALNTRPSAVSVDPSVPAPVNELISRAMAKDPADRPQTAEEFRTELRRLIRTVKLDSFEELPPPRRQPISRLARYAGVALAATTVLALTALLWWWTPWHRTASTSERARVAVLPFANTTGDSSKAYLGVGIADTLTTSLSQLSSIDVVSRTAFDEAGPLKTTDVRTIARDLGATMLVQGSIQQSGERLRVSAALINQKGEIIWTGDSEAPLSNVFSLENRLAGSLIDALRVSVSGDERRRVAQSPTSNQEALDAYWQALAILDRADNPNLDKAIDNLQHALTLDSRFSLAHAALGEAYRRKSIAVNDTALMNRAINEVSAALTLDPDQADVRVRLANVYKSSGRNGAAVDEIRRVMAEQPSNDDAHRLLGDLLADEGRPNDALAELQRAVALRPAYWRNYQSLGVFYLRSGRTNDAVTTFSRLIELKPDDGMPYQQLGTAYQMLGDREHARLNYERSLAISPNPSAYANLGMIHYAEGRYEQAAQAYEQAVRLVPTRALYQRNLGDVYLKLGKSRAAHDAYEQAAQLAEGALSLNPTDATTMSQLAVYEAKLGKRTDADRHSSAALALNPSSPEMMYRRAVVLALSGDLQGALAGATEAISKGYSKRLVLEDDDLSPLRSLPAFKLLTASGP